MSASAKYYAEHDADWEFSQMFGEEDDPSNGSGSESGGEGARSSLLGSRVAPVPFPRLTSLAPLDNWISSLAFDVTGKFLAVGYNCGQVVVLTQQEDQTYQLYTEFKSHDSEFDFLTSMEIEEKINMIKWFPFKNQVQHLLTTNGT